MDVNDKGEEEGTRAGGIGSLRWSAIVKGRKRGKRRLSMTGGRGRLALTGVEEGTRAGGTGCCQKWWSMMVDIIKGRRRGKGRGVKKKRKKAISGWRKRYVGADERGTLMARERKRELVVIGSGGLRWSTVVKENKKKRRKVVNGWRKR
ncbi:hypothetical protein OIU76_023978 [Salix suchowensis]|nr:hypothetical protein OIU76_023978 [Salix suchowensis]